MICDEGSIRLPGTDADCVLADCAALSSSEPSNGIDTPSPRADPLDGRRICHHAAGDQLHDLLPRRSIAAPTRQRRGRCRFRAQPTMLSPEECRRAHSSTRSRATTSDRRSLGERSASRMSMFGPRRSSEMKRRPAARRRASESRMVTADGFSDSWRLALAVASGSGAQATSAGADCGDSANVGSRRLSARKGRGI